ncbi:hypothetical protein M0R45_036056 [Rubus argutus]|uniref:MHC class I antigen n=1 Tax=Rubus argutus TaxID=59490 RepID=A0AAW1VZ49_RUBAR
MCGVWARRVRAEKLDGEAGGSSYGIEHGLSREMRCRQWHLAGMPTEEEARHRRCGGTDSTPCLGRHWDQCTEVISDSSGNEVDGLHGKEWI